jgi:hypothetical protein
MASKQQVISRTPFKKQAEILATVLRTNPIFNDDEKASLNETVGVLTWLNQLQLQWGDSGKKTVPADIEAQLFAGRPALKTEAKPRP